MNKKNYFILLFISCFIHCIKGALNKKPSKPLALFICSGNNHPECKTFDKQETFDKHQRKFHGLKVKGKDKEREGYFELKSKKQQQPLKSVEFLNLCLEIKQSNLKGKTSKAFDHRRCVLCGQCFTYKDLYEDHLMEHGRKKERDQKRREKLKEFTQKLRKAKIKQRKDTKTENSVIFGQMKDASVDGLSRYSDENLSGPTDPVSCFGK